jgi:hypothetical protein
MIMRRFTIQLTVGVIVVLLVVTSAVSAAPKKAPFIGAWRGEDAADGSQIKLRIGGGHDTYRIVWKDSSTDICEDSARALIKGRATLSTESGYFLTAAEMSVKCLAKPAYRWGNLDMQLEYDASTDTIYEIVEDQRATEFHRMGKGKK